MRIEQCYPSIVKRKAGVVLVYSNCALATHGADLLNAGRLSGSGCVMAQLPILDNKTKREI